jgi:beta-lactam-binding protein with PASTA domain
MRSILEEANLRLFVKSVPDYRDENTFLRQTPAAGSSTQAGRAVTVELSDGSQPRPTVPDLVGLDRQEAREVALEAGFSVVVRERRTDVESDDGLVLEQSLAPGDRYTPEDHPRLELVVGVFAEPGPPDDEGSPEPDPGSGDPGDGEPTADDAPGNGNGGGNNGNGNGGGGG